MMAGRAHRNCGGHKSDALCGRVALRARHGGAGLRRQGVDSLALRIRAVAAEHDVPVIDNPPLARALHATVDLDAEIPVEHYKAAAEVIGAILRLRRRPA